MNDEGVSPISGAAMDRKIDQPRRRFGTRARRGAIAVAAVLALFALWFVVPSANSLSVDADTIQTGAIVRAPFRDYVPLRAAVVPLSTNYVTAVSGGQVATVIANDGVIVEKGQPLATLANPTLQLDVASRSADVAGQLSSISGQRLAIQRSRFESGQAIADAQNELLKARTELQKRRSLYQKGIVNIAAIRPLEDEVTYRQQRVAALQAGQARETATLTDQQARVDDTARELRDSLAMVRHSLDSLTIRAPVTGRLTDFPLQPGQTLKPGDQIGQVDSEGAWKLSADVDQFYLGRAKVGQSAAATIDGTAVPMHVIRILPQVTDGRFKVELGFDGKPPAGLNRGQTVDVRLVLGADRPAIVAPAGGWLDGGGTVAFVLEPGGRTANRRAVTTGRRNPDQVEVTGGLIPGERIVTSPIAADTKFDRLIIR